MQYRINSKNGEKISALGYGCMRLPQKDKEKCKRLIDSAISAGINYFDTAYLYTGNEVLMGELLGGGLRDKIKLATKLPPAFCSSKKDFDKFFYTQLKRLSTDRIDYYLIHSLFDFGTWKRLCDLGIEDWIKSKKDSEEIINIGFSFHGGQADFCKLIDSFPWDFAQIQYNYLDENNQAGLSGLNHAYEKGVPIIIMEPLRGGKLVNGLPDAAQEVLSGCRESAAELGLRWVWNHPGVMCVLSGMNDDTQLSENIRIAENALPNSMSNEELSAVKQIKDIFGSFSVIPCTGCGYCMPCPFGVAIPSCFSARNEFEMAKKSGKYKLRLNPARNLYMQSTGLLGSASGNAAKCRKCGKCETHCPQSIKIRDELDKVKKTMEPWWFTFGTTIARKVNTRKVKK